MDMTLPFADFGLQWFEDIIGRLTMWFTQMLTGGYEALSRGSLTTPTPAGSGLERALTKPASSDAPWHSIYEATVAGEMMFFGLIVLFLCVQGRHFIRIFGGGSTREHRQTRRSAVTGGFLIVSWYWVSVLFLSIIEALTIGILPDVNRVGTALATMLPQGLETPILTLCMAAVGGLSIVFLRALFVLREVLLYVFLYTMPIGIAVVYGNIPIVSEIARRIGVQFVSLAVLPLPTALLFRGYELLFIGSNTLPVSGPFVKYIVAISLPVLAVFVTWKTFSYAAPLASRSISRAGRGAALLGTAGTAAYVAGPRAAAMTARWGAKGAATAAATERYRQTNGEQPARQPEQDASPNAGGVPEYRRKENDPAYY
jgi:hypothetical protein